MSLSFNEVMERAAFFAKKISSEEDDSVEKSILKDLSSSSADMVFIGKEKIYPFFVAAWATEKGSESSCFGDKGTVEKIPVVREQDIDSLNDFLLEIAPNITFLQYKSLMKEAESFTWYVPDYYQSYTKGAGLKVSLESVLNKLVDFNLIKPDTEGFKPLSSSDIEKVINATILAEKMEPKSALKGVLKEILALPINVYIQNSIEFDYPNYWGVSERYTSKLTVDEVNFVQDKLIPSLTENASKISIGRGKRQKPK